jgi:phosphotriesterase-related protein
LKSIPTANGEIAPEELGFTAPHEHMFLKIDAWIDPNADPTLLNAPVTMDILADLKWKDGQSRDNSILSSSEDALVELRRFKNSGGRSVIDVSPIGTGRDVVKLSSLEKAADVNIIIATGWYTDASYPPLVKESTPEQLVQIMIEELSEGIEGTEIRAGIIGELGCSEPLTPNEQKVLAAGAKAQSSTRVPLTVHTALFDVDNKRHAQQAIQELEILRKNDADLSKVYISHMDFTCSDIGYQEKIMDDYGVILDYDTFGQEQFYDNIFVGAGGVSDKERIAALVNLLSRGYEKQLMLSCDVCEKIHLRKYGGWGYSHVLENIIPLLRVGGVSERQIETMTIHNPRALFS